MFLKLWHIIGDCVANHYIREGASGSADGSDWTNAWTDLPASFVRGDTYYVADGAYGGHAFDQGTSGTTWVYVKKAIAADHGTATGWADSYGDGTAIFLAAFTFGSDYWEIDGQVGSNRTGYGFEVVNDNSNLIAPHDGADHITIKYCNIHNYPEGTTLVQLEAGNFHSLVYSLNPTYLTFSHCYLHHVFGTHFLTRSGDHITIEYCWISENGSTAEQHGELWSDDGSDNVVFRYNKCCDIDGTAYIFCGNGEVGSIADTWDVYGNIFRMTGTWGGSTSGVILVDDQASNHVHAKDWNVFNNTIYMIAGYFSFNFASVSTIGVLVKNNLIYQNRPDNQYVNYGFIDFGGGAGTYDYNYYGLCAFPESFNNAAHENTIYGGPNCDLSDAVGFPGFVDAANGDFHLKGEITDYPGLALASPYNVDMDGVLRGQGAGWDIGAYEYAGGDPLDAPFSKDLAMILQ